MANGARRYQLKCALAATPSIAALEHAIPIACAAGVEPARLRALRLRPPGGHAGLADDQRGRWLPGVEAHARSAAIWGSSGSRSSCRSWRWCCPADRSPTASIAASSSPARTRRELDAARAHPAVVHAVRQHECHHRVRRDGVVRRGARLLGAGRAGDDAEPGAEEPAARRRVGERACCSRWASSPAHRSAASLAIFGYHVVYGIACALLTFTVLMVANVRPVRPQGPATQWRWHSVLDGFRFVVQQEAVVRRDLARPVRRVVRRRHRAAAGVSPPTSCTSTARASGLLRAAPGVGAAIVASDAGLARHRAARRALDVRRRRRVRRRDHHLRTFDQLLVVARSCSPC